VRVDNQGQNFFVTPAKISPAGVKGAEKYHSGDDHVRNFLDCVKSRSEPASPVEIAHRSATLCHLGNIAIRLQAKLKWDPKAERFTGEKSAEANALLSRPSREISKT
jgi:Oxidoreductase family, C-terminal alpha/beta domain